MSAVPDEGIEVDMVPGPGGTWWRISERDDAGRPIAITEMHDVAVVRDASGTVLGFSIGVHPSRGRGLDVADVLFKPDEVIGQAGSAKSRTHACAMLADLDCYAAAGDQKAARLARWHVDHPNGPQTPEEAVEEQAIRAGFAKRPKNSIEVLMAVDDVSTYEPHAIVDAVVVDTVVMDGMTVDRPQRVVDGHATWVYESWDLIPWVEGCDGCDTLRTLPPTGKPAIGRVVDHWHRVWTADEDRERRERRGRG